MNSPLQPPIDAFQTVLDRAFAEDRVTEDPTSALLPADLSIEAAVIAREPIVVSGVEAARRAFGAATACEVLIPDGTTAAPNAPIVRIRGAARSILPAERTVLNLMARLSGIATLTRRYVDALAPGSKTVILDTRKTTPGLRLLEKYAVLCGGGTNHRMNLAEAVFVKDNHIAAAGGLDALLARGHPEGFLVIEIESPDQIEAALRHRPDRLLLDNMTDEAITASVQITAGRAELEVSGGVTLERIPTLSRFGVNFISVGALTHAATSVNLSLEVKKSES